MKSAAHDQTLHCQTPQTDAEGIGIVELLEIAAFVGHPGQTADFKIADIQFHKRQFAVQLRRTGKLIDPQTQVSALPVTTVTWDVQRKISVVLICFMLMISGVSPAAG